MQISRTGVDVRKESLYIGLAALFLFTVGLRGQPFVDFDSRFALFAHEMWRHGPTFFPTTYGAPYPDYPATSTFLIWCFSLLSGGVTKLSAVLPTALASALNLTITYRLLARFSRRWALSTVCFELLTVSFLAEARAISLDQMVATVTLLGFYVAHTGQDHSRRFPLTMLLLLLAVGFAIRGPLGLVIPAGVVCSYYFLSAEWKNLLRFALASAALLLVCWFGLLELAAYFHGADFRREVIDMQMAGRMTQGENTGRWYYFTSSLGNYALSYPLAVLVVFLLAVSRMLGRSRLPEDDAASFLRYLIGWTLIVIAGLSVPDARKVRYLLPIVPAIAALAAYPLHAGIDPQRQRVLVFLRKALEGLLLLLPTVALIGLWESFHHTRTLAVAMQVPFLPMATLLVVLQGTMLCLRWRGSADTALTGELLGAVATVFLLNLLVVEPARLQLHDTSAFVRQVEALRQRQPGEVVFFRVGRDATAIKYLVNLDYDLQPKFFDGCADFDSLAATPTYVIVNDEDLPAARECARLQSLAPVVHEHFDRQHSSVFYLPGVPAT